MSDQRSTDTKLPSLWIFLAGVAVVRFVHLGLLDSLLIGMNARACAQAQHLLNWGLGAGIWHGPPGPSLLLAGLSWLTGAGPAGFLFIVLLASHLGLAHGYWRWLSQVVRSSGTAPRGISLVALGVFVFLPGLNSYEGFDNLPALLAAAFCLNLLALLERMRVQPVAAGPIAAIAACAFAAVMCRSEYLLLVPFYVVLRWLLSLLDRTAPRHVFQFVSVSAAMLGLAVGACTVMAVRWVDEGQASLARPGYVCWTFLDGTPATWQLPGDATEAERVASGIRIFGHPARWGYSAPRIVLAQPRLTALKAVLNIQRWAYELFRRHIVIPVAVTALAVVGLMRLFIDRRRRASWRLQRAAVFAALLMTLPLTSLMLYAEYLMVSFAPICLVAAVGVVTVQDAMFRLSTARLGWLSHPAAAVCALAVALELFFMRGQGNDPRTPPPPRTAAKMLDQHYMSLPEARVLIDPASVELECLCQTDIRNEWLWARPLIDQLGRLPAAAGFQGRHADPLALIQQKHPSVGTIDHVVLWSEAGAAGLDDRLRQWERAGYHPTATAIGGETTGISEMIYLNRGE